MKTTINLTSLFSRISCWCQTKLAKLRSDQRGVSAIEFAMVLPFMLILLIGSIEATDIFNQDRKISRIANSVTDLVAQAQTVTSSELSSLMDIGEKILDPYPSTDLDIVVASVSFNDEGKASIDWRQCKASCAGWNVGGEPPITLPDTIAVPETSIVIGEASLDYSPTFTGFFNRYLSRESSYDLSDIYYLKPRLTNQVTCDDC